MIQVLPNPTNMPDGVTNGYQRQNNNIFALQTGLDAVKPHDDGAGVISIPAGGVFEFNGVMFKVTGPETLVKPVTGRMYWIAVSDNGDGSASFQLVESPGLWDDAKRGFYKPDGRLTLKWHSLGSLYNMGDFYYPDNNSRLIYASPRIKGVHVIQYPPAWIVANCYSGASRSGSHGANGNPGAGNSGGTGGAGGAGGVVTPESSFRAGTILNIFLHEGGVIEIIAGGDGGNGYPGGSGGNGVGPTGTQGTQTTAGGGGGGGGGGAAGIGERTQIRANGRVIYATSDAIGYPGRGGNGGSGAAPGSNAVRGDSGGAGGHGGAGQGGNAGMSSVSGGSTRTGGAGGVGGYDSQGGNGGNGTGAAAGGGGGGGGASGRNGSERSSGVPGGYAELYILGE